MRVPSRRNATSSPPRRAGALRFDTTHVVFSSHNGKRASYGHSTIVDPWGEVLVELGTEENTIGTAVVDLDLVTRVRANMPVAIHRFVHSVSFWR